ncbi:magnesium-transporting ATPase (P-type) [Rhizomicrobium palustre]|jgi:hypothetical protein|uniref:Magnesium-transporting ATPase (P-type) n=1 Tax=Rhizomicrobium palustre TaxID=189966 RepID=A0A846N0Q4_9PROT|nr:hypothetical protein [Rhizomicrobium palustre]NIK89276.1 magnesium-transporting ATPase (P-type) [Rhizomicrobium palustre]
MDTFNFLSVLFSVIVGLALTDVLQGFRKLIHARQRVIIFWPMLIWGAVMILILVQTWWGMFAMRNFAHWTFAMYGAVIGQITLMYLAAGVTMPEVPEEGPAHMEAAYFANKDWFFGLLAATVLATFLKDFILVGHVIGGANFVFLFTYLVFAVIAVAVKSRWYHLALAPVAAAGVLANAALMSYRL